MLKDVKVVSGNKFSELYRRLTENQKELITYMREHPRDYIIQKDGCYNLMTEDNHKVKVLTYATVSKLFNQGFLKSTDTHSNKIKYDSSLY